MNFFNIEVCDEKNDIYVHFWQLKYLTVILLTSRSNFLMEFDGDDRFIIEIISTKIS